MKRLTGPRVCTYRYPRHFAVEQKEISRTPLKQRIEKVYWARHGASWDAGGSGWYASIREIVNIVVASDFHPEVLAMAKESLSYRYREGRFPNWFRFRQFKGHWRYFLGALFEVLPRKKALKIFEREYLPGYYCDQDAIEAGQALLRFSSPQAAANSIKGPMARAPKRTFRLITTFITNKQMREYPDCLLPHP